MGVWSNHFDKLYIRNRERVGVGGVRLECKEEVIKKIFKKRKVGEASFRVDDGLLS